MKSWRKALIVIGVVLFLAGPYVTSYFAAAEGTNAAIHSAEAAQTSAQGRAQTDQVLQAEENIQKVVDYVESVQNGPQSQEARDVTSWYIAEFRAICAKIRCKQVPLPRSLP